MDPEGKVALVTGAAQGIGLVIVKELLSHGVKGVTVCDVNEEKGETVVQELHKQYAEDTVIFVKTDVRKEEELEAAFQQTFEKFGGLDIVVNNAGICNDQKWREEVSINLNGVIQGTLLALKYLGKDQGGSGGVIVNMSSVAGLGAGNGLPMYSATKSAINEFSRNIGGEYFWETTGVRVMAVCPGVTDTELISGRSVEGNFFTYKKEWVEALNRQAKKNRAIQNPEAVGEAVLHVIREGQSGSLWISAGSKPTYEISIPTFEGLELISPNCSKCS